MFTYLTTTGIGTFLILGAQVIVKNL